MAILTNGYGTGLSIKQKQANSIVLKPLLLAEATAAADDTTPSVANINVLKIGANTGSTAITQLDGAIPGQIVTILITSATNSSTIANSGNFKLSANFTPNAASDGVYNAGQLIYRMYGYKVR